METAGTGAERHRCAAYRQHRASQAGTYDTREVLFIAPADFGGSAEAAENILRVAGFTPDQYGNEPDSNDTRPFAANPITNTHLDDGGANYSGTGRLSSAAPKQVIVNIESLLSVRTIDLMKSKEGQTEEIQNLKEQLAQALIDVVHDFDASWNA